MSVRVVVGMSGGVDSAVAARLLQEEGCDVVGVFLHLGAAADGDCSAPLPGSGLAEARRIAGVLGIELRERDAAEPFREAIVRGTAEAYAEGLTPNPCVLCNERLKLAELERAADDMGADAVATGHYARAESPSTGTARLLRARDRAKDQSYFLHRLAGDRLRKIRFPLGGLSKPQVRRCAATLGLSPLLHEESQELCFVEPGRSYADLVERWCPDRLSSGSIVDTDGRELGRHDGIHRFTIGQRRGLDVAVGRRLYVADLRPETGTVVVGGPGALERREIAVGSVAWVAGGPPSARFRAVVRVRARHSGVAATVTVDDRSLVVTTDEPVRAAAPGQAAVFYRGDEVLGGGWILRRTAQ